MASWFIQLALMSAFSLSAGVGDTIENFTLKDYRGKDYSLADFGGKRAVVVAFLGTECPLAKLYAPKLQAMAEKWPEDVAILGVDSNCQDSITELESFVQSHKLTFPMLKDPGNKVADQLSAVRTPEIFLLDDKGVVRYHGRIDDQYVLGRTSSYAKYEVTRNDLVEAVEELLAGKPVSVAETEPTGCFIGRLPTKQGHGDVTYSKQIARILQERCVECHREGEVAPFALSSYDEVVGWSETILEVTDNGRMPPWYANPKHGEFANDARLTDEEHKLLATWVENGSPEGDPADLPKPKEYVEGWRIGEPDQVIEMRRRPYKVKAEGVIPYQYMVADPGWKEDRWIQAAEARPGNRQVVHHIIVFVLSGEGGGLLGGRGGARGGGEGRGAGGLAAYAPGNAATVLPEGAAIFVPANSKLVFQMHYTAVGTVQEDLSYVGVKFADPDTVRRQVINGMVASRDFVIPPGDPNYPVLASRRTSSDVLLLSMAPHMHLRGKSFRYTAKYPDGTEEILLDVPHYDPDWQLTYELKEPKLIPAGTLVECQAYFDNSPENLSNPDPTKSVRWGPQTWDEMMIGFFKALPTKDRPVPGRSASTNPVPSRSAKGG